MLARSTIDRIDDLRQEARFWRLEARNWRLEARRQQAGIGWRVVGGRTFLAVRTSLSL
jgi:hypothetical protein